MAMHVGVRTINKRRRFCVEVEITRKQATYIKEKCDNYVAEMRQQDGGVFAGRGFCRAARADDGRDSADAEHCT